MLGHERARRRVAPSLRPHLVAALFALGRIVSAVKLGPRPIEADRQARSIILAPAPRRDGALGPIEQGLEIPMGKGRSVLSHVG